MQSLRKRVMGTFLMVSLAASCYLMVRLWRPEISRRTLSDTCLSSCADKCAAFDLPEEAVSDCGGCNNTHYCHPGAYGYNDLEAWCTYNDCSSNESRCGHELCIKPTLLSGSQQTCDSYGLDTASSEDECETLADLYNNETYAGISNGNMTGCFRLREANSSAGAWYFSNTGSNETTCSGRSNQGSGYECLCKSLTYNETTTDGTPSPSSGDSQNQTTANGTTGQSSGDSQNQTKANGTPSPSSSDSPGDSPSSTTTPNGTTSPSSGDSPGSTTTPSGTTSPSSSDGPNSTTPSPELHPSPSTDDGTFDMSFFLANGRRSAVAWIAVAAVAVAAMLTHA